MIQSIWFNTLCIYQNLCWFLLKHKVKNPINTLFLVEVYIMHIDWLPIKKSFSRLSKILLQWYFRCTLFLDMLTSHKDKKQKMGNLRLILNLVESLWLIFYILPFNQKKTRSHLRPQIRWIGSPCSKHFSFTGKWHHFRYSTGLFYLTCSKGNAI